MPNSNSQLNKARREKNDEFYTQMHDIEEELQYYRDHFRGKFVYLNCDWPWSNFYKYFARESQSLGLKRLVATGTDFRSSENIALLKEADIVVSNPPFSLFKEYVAQLVEYDKKFLIVGNKNAITYKEIFPLIKDGRLWVGYDKMSGSMFFDVPEEYAQKLIDNGKPANYRITNGKVQAAIAATWFTNMDHSKRHEELKLFRRYSPEWYQTYDNYDAINVNKVKDIPEGYTGPMGVPITFLDKYNPDQFDILGQSQLGGIPSVWLGGKEKYRRIIIKRK